MNLLNRFYTP